MLVVIFLLLFGAAVSHQFAGVGDSQRCLAFNLVTGLLQPSRVWDSNRVALEPIHAESRPLTSYQVDQIESEHVGFEAEEPRPPKCPLMAHHLSKRVVKAMVEHDTEMLMQRSLDPYGRPRHLRQKWNMTRNRRRLDPVLFRVGEKVKGRVAVAFPTYALVDVGSTSYGVLHARDMSEGWIDRVDHSVSSGDDIVVIVKSIDPDSRFIRLSLLDLPKLESPTGEPIERRPLHSFRVEEAVSGIIRRRSPLGFYIDIGATVDGFLHVNDRKLPRKFTGVARQPFRIGTRVPTLYVKSVDLVKNRIQLSENSLPEELEKRCLTGQETPEQQALYSPIHREPLLNRLSSHDLDRMRLIGGFDDIIEQLGCDRNASVEYIKYLQNRKQREDLQRRKDTVFDDADNMPDWKLRQATREYNDLAMEIAELNNEAIEPPPPERTVYKYGDPGVWESRVYTRFDEKNPGSYFQKLNSEVQTALRDVQGDNFNFKGAMLDDYSSPERRGAIIESLWERFHAPPSNTSEIKDTESRVAYLEDVEDILPASDVPQNSEPTDEPTDGTSYADAVIAELESYNDSDADELAAMLRSAEGFDPFAASPKLVDDDQSAILGACAMTNDDVTKWPARFDRLCREAGGDPMKIALDTLAGNDLGTRDMRDLGITGLSTSKSTDGILNIVTNGDYDDLSVPNVDDSVDSTPGAVCDSNFSAPKLESDPDDLDEELPFESDGYTSEVDCDSAQEGSIDDSGYNSDLENDIDSSDTDYDIDSSDLEDNIDSSDIEDDIYNNTDYDDESAGYISDYTNDDSDEDTNSGYSSEEDDFKDIATSVFGKGASTQMSPLGPKMDMNTTYSQTKGKVPRIDASPRPTSKGPLEPVKKYYNPPTMDDYINEIFNEVKAITGDSTDSKPPATDTVLAPVENRDSLKISRQIYKNRRRNLDPVTRLYMMTKLPPRQLPSGDGDRTNRPTLGPLRTNGGSMKPIHPRPVPTYNIGNSEQEDNSEQKLDYWTDDSEEEDDEDMSPEEVRKLRSAVKSICNSDQKRRTIYRMAKKILPPEVIAKCQVDSQNHEHMEELVTLLRAGKQRPKLKPYTYYPEGIDKADIGKDRRSTNRRIRDAHLKLKKLKRNKRFLHMLDRLGIDPDQLTFDNVHELLPQELVTSRPLPFKRQMGLGEYSQLDNRG
ncbi:RNA binding protein, putative [Babesia ovis]|uniref:RNA binding protein, putative n=1 Tax=Babesia ovis TaxID=5869 RepID=A0A9W5TD87_BABOV|nr:RNA binding protein, putative [Babesia ovis]